MTTCNKKNVVYVQCVLQYRFLCVIFMTRLTGVSYNGCARPIVILACYSQIFHKLPYFCTTITVFIIRLSLCIILLYYYIIYVVNWVYYYIELNSLTFT